MTSTTPRRFRFGLTTTHAAPPYAVRECARRLEGEGWATLLMREHAGPSSIFAPLVSAASVTSELRVGTLAANDSVPDPVLLAHEAAAVNLLVDGRLELGLGAARRTDTARMRSTWAEGAHVPLLLTDHDDDALALAAQEADIVALNGLTVTGSDVAPDGAGFDAVAARVRLLEAYAGERFSRLELGALTLVASVGGDADRAVLPVASALGLAPDVVRDSPLALVGSASEVVDKLLATRERLGISYVMVRDTAMDEMGPVVAALAGT
ncbi:LLM class flavin-dependent oxidoreductase [Promicromonospora sukumoe]|uniref:LLM class flavin-dependent oxidoreductase n=1 Tax=Promicromonospora sukumoe TaxID=88382 RepID=UPI0037CA1D44